MTQKLLISLLAGITALSMIAVFVLRYKKRILEYQLKERSRQVDLDKLKLQAQVEAQENERNRIAKDLHDDVGLMLQALRTTTLAVLQQAPEEDRKEVQQIVTEVDETVRRICWNLMPTSLEYFGLTEAVDELCNRSSISGSVKVNFSSTGIRKSITKKKQALLYRMIQELVDNALKHAHADAVEVKFTWTETALQINVMDNGIGFNWTELLHSRKPNRGLGLFGIENRATLLPARLAYETNFPQGANISVNFLIAHHAEN